ncbi:hypothetical protein OSG_eHP36_00080 [environmental Halophage eHP-36]|jgi:hypothetical protein|nr:hypothetical protein OSG_eHP36_00080 [environmental Halophage eHP-36]
MTHTEAQTETDAVAQATDNIHIRVFDGDLKSPSDTAQASLLNEYSTHNETRDRYHEIKIEALAGTTVDLGVDAVALGDGPAPVGSLPKSTILDNETFRIGTVDLDAVGQTLTVTALLDTTQGNGQTFNEAAVVAERPGGDLAINRFLLDDPGGLLDPKNQDETVTIQIEITESDA